LHYCSALLALFLAEVQLAHHPTCAALPAPLCSFAIAEAFTKSLSPLDSFSLESPILRRGLLCPWFLGKDARATGEDESDNT
jgi:hypothetical protein